MHKKEGPMRKKTKKEKQERKIYGLIALFGYIVLLFYGMHCCYCYTIAKESSKDLLSVIGTAYEHMLSNPFKMFPIEPGSLECIGYLSLIYIVICIAVMLEIEKNRQSMPGKEKGDANWMDDMISYNKKFTDPKGVGGYEGYYNAVLGNDVRLSMNGRQTRLNNNVCVIGGSGAGKSRFFVKPNIMQLNCSFVITDPSGELLESMGQFLENKGYIVKVFNTVDMKKSNRYNPFQYIRDDVGVAQMVNCLIQNTTPADSQKGDPFWEKTETALLLALSYYLFHFREMKDRNFSTVLKLLRAAEIDENDSTARSDLDDLFAEIEKKYPEHIAVTNYKTFKMGAGRTLKSILISCAVRLNHFNIAEVAELTKNDNIELDKIGDRKTALFAVIPSADTTFNYLISLMYSQLFESLYYKAENINPRLFYLKNEHDVLISADSKKEIKELWDDIKNLGKIKEKEDTFTKKMTYQIFIDKNKEPVKVFYNKNSAEKFIDMIKTTRTNTDSKKKHLKAKKKKYEYTMPYIEKGRKELAYDVRFLLDEFANIGTIPDFDKKLATMRKYKISCSIVLQNYAQIKAMYEKQYEGLIGNCDSFLFLGSPEDETCKTVSRWMGDGTITVRNHSQSKGRSGSYSLSYNKDKRELMTADELRRLPADECIIIINRLRPIRTKKFVLEEHPMYNFTGDANPEFKFKNNINNFNIQHDREIAEKTIKEEFRMIQEAADHDNASKPIVGPAQLGDMFNSLDISTVEDMNRLVIEGTSTKNKEQDTNIEELKEKLKVKNELYNPSKLDSDTETESEDLDIFDYV